MSGGEGPAMLSDRPLTGYRPTAFAPILDAHLAAAQSRQMRGWAEPIGGGSALRPPTSTGPPSWTGRR
jgi:hypothetical protein